MKLIIAIAAVAGLVAAHNCPHDLEVLCIDDINKAYPVCQKASQ